MKTRVLTLPPGRLEPDMVLAASLPAPHGGELLHAGSVLDEALIAGLRRRGVRCVNVQVSDTRSPEAIQREITDAEARLAHIFRGESDELRQGLYSTLLEFRRSQLR